MNFVPTGGIKPHTVIPVAVGPNIIAPVQVVQVKHTAAVDIFGSFQFDIVFFKLTLVAARGFTDPIIVFAVV